MSQSQGSAFQLAFVYVGTVVGAGFATGREIVEFFLRFGWPGLAGILISGLMFTFLGAKMMLIAVRINAKSYQELNKYLFGHTLGKFVNVFMLVVLLGVTSVMLSGAGAIFEEQLGFSNQAGMIATIALSLFVMMKGVKGIFGVNVIVVPLLLLFTVVVLFDSFIFRGPEIHNLAVFSANPDWILSAVSYGAFNLSLAQAVLVPIASELKSERLIIKGALIGGVLLTLVLVASFLSLSTLPDALLYEVPMAQVVFIVQHSVHIIYLFIIFGEVFTSVIGNLYGLEKQINEYIHIKSLYVFIFILLTIYLTGQIGYGKLISTIYPLFGQLSLVFIFFLIVKRVPER
ncbi:YkvI family membrane protein [Bacillus licheniformis]|uniref:YkvI family membrane protein n=1 Tax=Bacillus licheniformis TaxID=1402 RepID=UPI0037122203